MEVYCRVVNTGLVGEPEHHAFQIINNLKIIEFESIKKVLHDGTYRTPNIDEDVKYVIGNMNQCCYILYNDVGNDQHTLILD